MNHYYYFFFFKDRFSYIYDPHARMHMCTVDNLINIRLPRSNLTLRKCSEWHPSDQVIFKNNLYSLDGFLNVFTLMLSNTDFKII